MCKKQELHQAMQALSDADRLRNEAAVAFLLSDLSDPTERDTMIAEFIAAARRVIDLSRELGVVR